MSGSAPGPRENRARGRGAALRTLLGGLPEGFDASVFVVMRVAADGPGLLPHILFGDCALGRESVARHDEDRTAAPSPPG